jgi:hypothetical protein
MEKNVIRKISTLQIDGHKQMDIVYLDNDHLIIIEYGIVSIYKNFHSDIISLYHLNRLGFVETPDENEVFSHSYMNCISCPYAIEIEGFPTDSEGFPDEVYCVYNQDAVIRCECPGYICPVFRNRPDIISDSIYIQDISSNEQIELECGMILHVGDFSVQFFNVKGSACIKEIHYVTDKEEDNEEKSEGPVETE